MNKFLSNKLISPSALLDRTGLKDRFRRLMADKGYLGLAFLIPFVLMTLIYAGMDVWPFGRHSILMLDMNGQYIYFFEQFRDIILGKGNLLYSFERAMGGEFFGIFAYYISSPFSFVTLLFPQRMITEAVFLMMVLKCASCGLTFGYYLHATRKRAPYTTIIFSTAYALTSYSVVMQNNIMWFDCIILLPLIVLGIEELIKYGKFKMYVICLAWAVFSNFYIGYMMCFFVAIYFFYYFIAHPTTVTNPRSERSHFIKSLVRIGICSAIALGIAAFIILTVQYSLTFGKSTFSTPNLTVYEKFDFLDLLTKLYVGSYDTVRTDGLPMIYTGLLTIILLPVYFLSNKIKLREKAATCGLAFLFLASFNVSVIDLFWHGMQVPNWLNYRYAFILCFVLLMMAVKAFDSLKETSYSVILASIAGWSILLLILQKLGYSNVHDFACVWLSIVFFAIYAFVIRFFTTTRLKQTAMTLLTAVVAIELFVGGLLNLAYFIKDVGYASRATYTVFMDAMRPAAKWVLDNDDSFYRFEKTISRKVNDNFALNIRGVTNSTSTLNRSIIVLLDQLGIASPTYAHWSLYTGANPVFDSLLGIKYLITPIHLAESEIQYYQTYSYKAHEGASELYEMVQNINDQFEIYKNPDALSIAYCVSQDMKEFDMTSGSYLTPFDRMNGLLSTMNGYTRSYKIFASASANAASPELNNCTVKITTGARTYSRIDASKPATITYTVTAKKDGHIYCFFPAETYYGECNLEIQYEEDGAFEHYSTYYGLETYTTVDLGEFAEGQTFRVRLSFDYGQLRLRSRTNYFVYVDEEMYDSFLSPLKEGQLNITDWSDTHFDGTISAKENQIVFTTLPYDAGWIVKVDGQRVDTYKVLDSLLAFDIDAGDHTVEMVYRPTCYVAGTTITFVSIGLFAGLWVLDTKRKKNNKIGFTVPGEELTPLEGTEEIFEENLPSDTEEDAGKADAPSSDA
ncbi:MAG: YfhO family protein [Clostridia bacterium]|nr:YfhO family protein [Clostridia bacterium]